MSSIREVAKLAGVSPATVSRVMNGTANVDFEKKERVLRAISETGFIPNEVARSLFKKSAKTIGLVLPTIENPFFAQLVRAVEDVADKNGYRVLLFNTGNNFEKEKSAFQILSAMNADGIILTSSDENIQPYIEMCNIPVVITDSFLANKNVAVSVYCDYYQGGKLAMEHLVACGCKSIVCIKGNQKINSAKARYQGYQEICEKYGITEQTVDGDYDFDTGLRVTEELLKKYPDVDGIIASNDMVAISVYKILHRNHIEVPKQVKLIGFDDINLSTLMTPELTTIVQPIKEMGEKAAELIIHNDKRENQEKEYVFPASLVIRETTKN